MEHKLRRVGQRFRNVRRGRTRCVRPGLGNRASWRTSRGLGCTRNCFDPRPGKTPETVPILRRRACRLSLNVGRKRPLWMALAKPQQARDDRRRKLRNLPMAFGGAEGDQLTEKVSRFAISGRTLRGCGASRQGEGNAHRNARPTESDIHTAPREAGASSLYKPTSAMGRKQTLGGS